MWQRIAQGSPWSIPSLTLDPGDYRLTLSAPGIHVLPGDALDAVARGLANLGLRNVSLAVTQANQISIEFSI